MSSFKSLKNAAQERAEEMIEESKDNASRVFENVRESVESVAHQIPQKASEYYSEGKKKMEQAYETTMEQKDSLIELIRDKPLSLVLIAAGLGYLFAKLSSKNK